MAAVPPADHRHSFSRRADRDLLEPRPALEDLTRLADTVTVRDHLTGDDRLAEPPARLDHPLVRPGDRILREHHAGGLGIEECLHDHADTWASEEADALA